jgi:hypothetical protein
VSTNIPQPIDDPPPEDPSIVDEDPDEPTDYKGPLPQEKTT